MHRENGLTIDERSEDVLLVTSGKSVRKEKAFDRSDGRKSAMLSFLCILLGSFQFAFLLLVTGFLLSLAIISRLMEILVTLVHPTSVFLLRQSVKLFVLIFNTWTCAVNDDPVDKDDWVCLVQNH